jgi:hypothetical protein
MSGKKKINLKDINLEDIIAKKNHDKIHYFSEGLFQKFKEKKDEFINYFENYKPSKKEAGIISSPEIRNQIFGLISQVLDEFLVENYTPNEKTNIDEVLITMRSLRVTFQGFFNYTKGLKKNDLVEFWQTELLLKDEYPLVEFLQNVKKHKFQSIVDLIEEKRIKIEDKKEEEEDKKEKDKNIIQEYEKQIKQYENLICQIKNYTSQQSYAITNRFYSKMSIEQLTEFRENCELKTPYKRQKKEEDLYDRKQRIKPKKNIKDKYKPSEKRAKPEIIPKYESNEELIGTIEHIYEKFNLAKLKSPKNEIDEDAIGYMGKYFDINDTKIHSEIRRIVNGLGYDFFYHKGAPTKKFLKEIMNKKLEIYKAMQEYIT